MTGQGEVSPPPCSGLVLARQLAGSSSPPPSLGKRPFSRFALLARGQRAMSSSVLMHIVRTSISIPEVEYYISFVSLSFLKELVNDELTLIFDKFLGGGSSLS